jgi:hypothetical protein
MIDVLMMTALLCGLCVMAAGVLRIALLTLLAVWPLAGEVSLSRQDAAKPQETWQPRRAA